MVIRRVLRGGLKLGVAGVLVLCVLLVYAARVGVPSRWVPRLLTPSGRGSVVVEANVLKFNIMRGGVASKVKLYVRGQVGPPFFEVEDLAFDFDVLGPLKGTGAIQNLRASSGLLRLRMLKALGGGGTPLGSRAWSLPFDLRDMTVEGSRFDVVTGLVRADRDWIRVEDFRVTYAEGTQHGELRGHGAVDRLTGRPSVEMTMTGNPFPVLPLLDSLHVRTTSTIIRRMDFRNSEPRWQVKYIGRGRDGSQARMEGQIWLQDFTYRGVECLRADSKYTCDWTATNTVLRFDPLVVVREEGVAINALWFDIRRGNSFLYFDSRSGLEPIASARVIGLLETQDFAGLTLNPPYRVAGRGAVGLDGQGNDLTVDVHLGSAGRGAFMVEDLDFTLHHTGLTNHFSNVQGVFYGGAFTGKWDMIARDPTVGRTNAIYRVKAGVEQADFERFMNAVTRNKSSELRGRFTTSWDVTGNIGSDWARSMVGEGTLGIRDGRVFMLPVFGGLTSFLSKTIPGLDLLFNQTSAKASFDIQNGYARSKNIRVDGDIFSLRGEGNYLFDRRLDFDVQVTFLKSNTLAGKVVRIPTFLLSKLFEFRLGGTLEQPNWYPVNFSRESRDVLGRDVGAPASEEDEAPD